jgi:peptidoglycan/LPS O-acetylase OafA/YrhL
MGNARYGGHAVFREYTWWGDRGVDFFFVLSGFIILFAHFEDIDKPRAWTNYIYRRFVRLFPIYWLYTLAFAVLVLVVGSTDAKLPDTMVGWITSLSLIRFNGVTPPLPMAWTLFHELSFYLVFSILILSRRAGLLAFAVFILPAIWFYQYPVDGFRTPFNTYTAAYNLFFLFGMGAYWLYRRRGHGFIELMFGLLCSAVAILTSPLPHELSRLFLVFGFAFVLAGATKLELSGYIRVPYFIAIVGDASYTIYLTHVNLEGALLKIGQRIHLQSVIGSRPFFFLVFIGTALLGCAAYLAIERPLLKILRRRNQQPSAKHDGVRAVGAES